MDASVEIENLRKVFILRSGWGRSRVEKEIVAVDQISLSVPAGQSVAFIGPNGAGKSTTIKMLTGILHPTSGSAQVLGFTPWQERRKLVHQIGAVFGQRSQLWYHLPPRDTFELLARIYNLDRATYMKRRDLLIERFGLQSFLATPVRKLSLGQRMRAEVAASLLHAPKVLFLDEPTIGLDVIARQELRDLLLEWNRDEGVTVFLTSHDAGDVERVARRVIVINHGRVVLDDKVSALRRQYLGSKVLSVKFHEPPKPFSLAGVSTLKASEYALKLQVDTRVTPIEQVMSEVLRAGPVADIAIEDPPLEEVIAHIYGQAAAENQEPENQRTKGKWQLTTGNEHMIAFRKYTWLGLIAARSNLAYLGEVATRTLFLAVILYIFLQLWRVTYGETGATTLGGLTLAQMLWYLAMTEAITLSAPRVAQEVDQDVRTGALAVQLIRPLDYPLARLWMTLGERLVRFGLNVAVGAVLALLLVGPIAFTPLGLLMFALTLPLAFVLDFLGNFLIGLAAFWIEDTSGLALIYSRVTMILGGMLIPLELFPEQMQPVLRALPFAGIVYGPARMFVRPDLAFLADLALRQGIAIGVFAVLVALVYRVALGRIYSNGG